MSGRFWVVSYPKSGNTWMRFVLFHIEFARSPANSRELDAFMNSKSPAPPAERFKKSHAHAEALTSAIDDADRVISIVRHPLDVMQSSLNYARLTGEIDEAGEAAWLDAYSAAGGNPMWMDKPFLAGRWADNVESWRRWSRTPILRLTYEDFLADPSAGARALAAFVGRDMSAAHVADCVAATTFDALREFEDRELDEAARRAVPVGRFSAGSRLQSARNGLRFFNTGEAGAWRRRIDRQYAERLWREVATAAEPLGYRLDG
jgi:hypothetical protein